jgi:hypothetical protein
MISRRGKSGTSVPDGNLCFGSRVRGIARGYQQLGQWRKASAGKADFRSVISLTHSRQSPAMNCHVTRVKNGENRGFQVRNPLTLSTTCTRHLPRRRHLSLPPQYILSLLRCDTSWPNDNLSHRQDQRRVIRGFRTRNPRPSLPATLKYDVDVAFTNQGAIQISRTIWNRNPYTGVSGL